MRSEEVTSDVGRTDPGRRVRVVPHALWIATAVTILVPSAADPDLWGHLLFGSLLLDGTHYLENTFAYTTPSQPWVNHELLAELTMAGLYRLAGGVGLVVLKVVLGLVTAALVWGTAARRSRDAIAATLAVVAALLVMAPGFMIRPQLFTMTFLAATLALLDRADFAARGPAWWLPLVVLVWVNTHGGVLAGVGLAGIALATTTGVGLARRRVDRRGAGAAVLLSGALGLALLLNPYGMRLIRFLVFEVTPHVPIAEWKPVPLLDGSFLAFKAMLVAAALGLAIVRPRLAEAVIVLVTAAVALRHQRHIPLFAIAAAPLLAATFAAALRHAGARTPANLAALARHGLTAAAALQIAVAGATAHRWRGDIAVSPSHYPVQAVRFLAQNGISGNVALPFRWGEYGLWALPAGSRVAVDGRFTTAYSGPFLDDVWRFMAGGPGWDALLRDYPTDVVIADRAQAPARLLRDDAEWAYVYSDPVSVVFLRRIARHAAALDRFHAGTLVYDRSPVPTVFPASAFREEPAPPSSATLPVAWRP